MQFMTIMTKWTFVLIFVWGIAASAPETIEAMLQTGFQRIEVYQTCEC